MENEFQYTRPGWIEVICGPMFSGKTEELIRRVKRAIISKQQTIIFKPKIDDRYHPENVVSHNLTEINAIAIEKIEDIVKYINKHQVIALDEAQFFSEKIVSLSIEWANKGKRIIIAGLDKDSFGKPFGAMHKLMCEAEYVTKLHAICVICGANASFTFRKKPIKKQILVGEKDAYEPRCRHCFYSGIYNIF
jgi:thymidine kinase